MTPPRSRLSVVALSDAFRAFWNDLALDLDVAIDVLGPAEAVAPHVRQKKGGGFLFQSFSDWKRNLTPFLPFSLLSPSASTSVRLRFSHRCWIMNACSL